MLYTKQALSFADQVALLESRKLIVHDRARAIDALSHISYYRLSAYFRPFRQVGSEDFSGASFDDILALYKFDKELRMHVSDALEAIEVHFRTRITYHLALRGGAFAYTDHQYFLPGFDHQKLMNDVKEMELKSSDKFVTHFQDKYTSESNLPIWMATELMSFGFLSKLYSSLTYDIQKEVAADIGVHRSILKGWLHTFSYVRNLCAHHGRLWNRELAIAPQIPYKNGRWPYLGVESKRCYCIIVLILDVLDRTNSSTRCKQLFTQFLLDSNDMQLKGMRVPELWRSFYPWFVVPKTKD